MLSLKVNTPRLKYRSFLFNLCIHVCIERGKENDNNYSLNFLRKVCILVKNKVNQTYILCIYIHAKKKGKILNLIYIYIANYFP